MSAAAKALPVVGLCAGERASGGVGDHRFRRSAGPLGSEQRGLSLERLAYLVHLGDGRAGWLHHATAAPAVGLDQPDLPQP